MGYPADPGGRLQRALRPRRATVNRPSKPRGQRRSNPRRYVRRGCLGLARLPEHGGPLGSITPHPSVSPFPGTPSRVGPCTTLRAFYTAAARALRGIWGVCCRWAVGPGVGAGFDSAPVSPGPCLSFYGFITNWRDTPTSLFVKVLRAYRSGRDALRNCPLRSESLMLRHSGRHTPAASGELGT